MSDPEIALTDELWEMSIAQAQQVLDAFLKLERKTFENLSVDNVNMDYTSSSVIGFAHFIESKIKKFHIEEEQQRVWFMRLGYYFGESLCCKRPGLHWGIGNLEYAFANYPVIHGFANGVEAPVITIVKNIIIAAVKDLSKSGRIDTCINSWFAMPVKN